ncbi:MAG: hypothetical protein CMN77_07485 [Spirochaetaceae bacterium]|nr:hypothetical protein [Spirochaetaceae bacterium]|tara:strand:- start:102 stop:1145 length:1044 start_codon:yes stop_codon:yes gene_type:complete
MKIALKYIVLPLLALFLLTEAFLRRSPTISSSVQERRMHCMDRTGLVFLCKNQSRKLQGPGNGNWTLTTNRYGERITHPLELAPDSPLSESNPTVKEVWVIGDSIAMGYLLSDPYSPPYLLSQLTGIRTRNLGVDSLGTQGIRIRLENALEYRAIVPDHIFWIYNVSDYVDDYREEKLLNNALYRMAYRVHFNLAKASYLYALTRIQPQVTISDSVYPEDTEDATQSQEVPENHPTIQLLRQFAQFIKEKELPVTVLFYPGMLPSGKPDLQDPYKKKSMEILKEEGIEVMDLSSEFLENDNMYIPGNGHPTERAASLFASAMAGKLALRHPAHFDQNLGKAVFWPGL